MLITLFNEYHVKLPSLLGSRNLVENKLLYQEINLIFFSVTRSNETCCRNDYNKKLHRSDFNTVELIKSQLSQTNLNHFLYT